MPILPENKDRYPPNWREISRRIRHDRAKNKCEVCGVDNHAVGYRGKDGTFYSGEYLHEQLELGNDMFDADNELGHVTISQMPITIVLTVAHLDHTPENCEDDNLKAMCQRCHNIYDRPHRNETRQSKKKQTKLF